MTQDRAACTIIAKNYVAFARTLARSFLSFHPDYKFYVLIVDEFEGYINPHDECFEIVKLSDLDIPDLPGLCFKYDIKELCTAAKADLLDYLVRQKSVDRLMYLDPDTLVTSCLDELYEKLDSFDVVLTPHLDTDYPDDGLLPDDGYILRAGQFNLGFIGINSSENARDFLNWWKPKLHKNCVVDLINGYFVDQRFIDFVPIFFKNVLIERGTGYNVAYWNLHSRKLSQNNGAWKCNGGPLYFFHFSGYTPQGAGLSSHIPLSLARHLLSNRRDLTDLFAKYSYLLHRNGYEETITWPYTFASFKSGELIPNETRRYYRKLGEEGRELGNPFESEQLKRHEPLRSVDNGLGVLTPAEQLSAILNSRAWRWVSRYGRFKNRYLSPIVQRFGRNSGLEPQRPAALKQEVVSTTNISVCFCTLAIHEPYRQRARLLCGDAPTLPWVVLTDEPDDFAMFPVRAIRHAPTSPMAVDYLARLPPTGEGRGAAAYHDKRFALLAALENFDTAVYVDADSRIMAQPSFRVFPPGLAVLPVVRKSIAEHLETSGWWRMPAFVELAQQLTGDAGILDSARWCHEALIAVTKDGRESRFFEAWSFAADFLQSRGVYSGEGGVIGLAGAYAGWSVDYEVLTGVAASIRHEGGGPKKE